MKSHETRAAQGDHQPAAPEVRQAELNPMEHRPGAWPAATPDRALQASVDQSPRILAQRCAMQGMFRQSPVVQRWLVPGPQEGTWFDDRNKRLPLFSLGNGRYKSVTGAVYVHEGQDQFRVEGAPGGRSYFDPATSRVLDRVDDDYYVLENRLYWYDGRFYQASSERFHSFNVPAEEVVLSNQIGNQPPVSIELYHLGATQLASTLTTPNGQVLHGNETFDRKTLPHPVEGRYRIRFDIYYGVGKSLSAELAYWVRNPSAEESLASEYEVPIYLGSHWTSSMFDADFSRSLLREVRNEVAQLGEGLYLTTDQDLGLKAGWDAVKRHGGDAVVEWRVFKCKGVSLRELQTALMDHDLNWKELPWKRDLAGGEVLRNYDIMVKPAAEAESKVNPRAFRKVQVGAGQRFVIKDNVGLFADIDRKISEMLKRQRDGARLDPK